jgi:protein phosphatase
MAKSVALTVGQRAEIGLRGQQEDAYTLELEPRGINTLERKGTFFVVADGVGGRSKGEVASNLAVTSIRQRYYSETGDDVIRSLQSAFTYANNVILQKALANDKKEMASTAVCAVIRGDELYVAHVGDSRAYWCHEGKLTRVTQDHSLVGEQLARKLISPEEARVSNDRNVITRSLGYKPRVEPEIALWGQLSHQDRLLLCTDGLYDVLEDEEIVEILYDLSPQDACDELVQLALNHGSGDNITAIVIGVELSGEAAPPCRPEPDLKLVEQYELATQVQSSDETTVTMPPFNTNLVSTIPSEYLGTTENSRDGFSALTQNQVPVVKSNGWESGSMQEYDNIRKQIQDAQEHRARLISEVQIIDDSLRQLCELRDAMQQRSDVNVKR